MGNREQQPLARRTILSAGLAASAGAAFASPAHAAPNEPAADPVRRAAAGMLLCEPYLLAPDRTGTRVVWHTGTPGRSHAVIVGPTVARMSNAQVIAAVTGSARQDGRRWRLFEADTYRLSQMYEDADSLAPQIYAKLTARPVYRHAAHITGMRPGQRLPYRVISIDDDDEVIISQQQSLATAPGDGPVTLWLTSDHQLKKMTPVNIQKVADTVGTELDGVLFAGDLTNTPDRASEWFDSTTGLAFFAGLTGRAQQEIAGRKYAGAPILQNTPLYPALGNHEVMGRRRKIGLDDQFTSPQPRWVAKRRADQGEATGDRESWIRDQSWNTTTYAEMFPWPASKQGGSTYWAETIGNVRLISLFITQIWRSPDPAEGVPGKFSDPGSDTTDWGYGQHIFEPISAGSPQYEWLQAELASPQWREAEYRVVMYHHPAHGLGDNSAPPFADPVQTIESDAGGAITSVKYQYSLQDDQILRNLEPLLTKADTHLVLNGHSHVWNRFKNAGGTNWLETSNVGNSYGAYDVRNGESRNLPTDPNYVRQGDPGGLEPIVPTVAPVHDHDGTPLPFFTSNSVTCFSILDSDAGVVRSYRFDTTKPDSDVVLFDEFSLK